MEWVVKDIPPCLDRGRWVVGGGSGILRHVEMPLAEVGVLVVSPLSRGGENPGSPLSPEGALSVAPDMLPGNVIG